MKYFKRISRILLVVLFIGIFGWFLATNWSDFSSLRITHPPSLIASVVLILTSLYSAGMVNDLTMEPHGVKLQKSEVFGLAVINRFLNQIAPNYVGASARAVYFKRRHHVSYAKFSSSFAVANVLQLIIASFIALVFYITFVNGLQNMHALAIVSLAFIGLVCLLMLPTRLLSSLLRWMYRKQPLRILENLAKLPGEYARVRSFPGLFPRMIFWVSSLVLISGLIIYTLFSAVGYNVSPGDAIFISAMANLSIILSVTPAGIGIREGMIVFAGSAVDVPIVMSLAVSILFRLVMATVTGLLSIYFSRKLMR